MRYAMKTFASFILAMPLALALAETPVQDQAKDQDRLRDQVQDRDRVSDQTEDQERLQDRTRDQDRLGKGAELSLQDRERQMKQSREAYQKAVREYGKSSVQAEEANRVMEEARERYRKAQREQQSSHEPARTRDQNQRMDGIGSGGMKGR